MTDREVLAKMYHLLLTEPHAPSLCDKLEGMVREALAKPMQEISTVANLDRIPLFTKEALEQDQNIWSRSADGSVKIIYEE